MDSGNTEIQAELHRLLAEMGSDFCALGLLDPESRILSWKWAAGNVSDRYRSIEDRPGRGFHQSVLKIGRAMTLQVSELIAARQVHEYPILLAEKLRSAYAVPLQQGVKHKGVLLIGDRVRRMYRPDDRNVAGRFGERLMSAVLVDLSDSSTGTQDL
ncbi:GAF domain-containing protein [Cohnella caldifontis]|uniref:GAF domain-containing protein n=1 Tax=Cohnella caldifontis TaxID=3027471 RepID=UPI0023EC57D2|nr:GAF domain-containing protein [Cohnella sp. YIM B05605]